MLLKALAGITGVNGTASGGGRPPRSRRNSHWREGGGPAFQNQSSHLAATFAFATVLPLATHVAGLAASLALATVHAFAVMLAHAGVGRRRFARAVARAAGDGEGAAGHQAGHGRGDD